MFESRPLADAVAKQTGGGTPPRQVAAYWNGPIPWASVKDFAEGGDVLLSTQESITAAGLNASASNLVPAGTPLVCTRMAVGRSAIAPMPVAINQDVKALSPATGTSPAYLLRLLQYLQPRANATAVGSTVKGIRIQDYLSIEVPMAPCQEQGRIAEVLDTLDTTIRQTEAIIEKLKHVKQGLLHDLLTRGIDANGELRPPQSQAPELYKKSVLGWIPREWEARPIHQVSDSVVDGPFGSNLKTEHYVPIPGVSVVRLQNIGIGEYDDGDRAYVSDVKARSLSRNQVVGGDVLIAALGDERYPVGRACCYPGNLPPAVNKADCFRLRPKFEIATAAFVMRSLNGLNARRQLRGFEQGVTMQRVNIGNLKKVIIALPTVTEQEAICQKVEAVDAALVLNGALVSKVRKQKSGLMDDLLTGRVRVTPLLD